MAHNRREEQAPTMEFEEFVRDALPRLTKLGRGIAPSREDANDLIAETLFRAYRRWRKISKMDNPSAYVKQMLVHLSIDENRSRLSRNRTEARLALSESRQLTFGSNAVTAVNDREAARVKLAALTSRERCALVLRHYMDLDYKQIGEMMSIQESSARSLVRRAVQHVTQAANDHDVSS